MRQESCTRSRRLHRGLWTQALPHKCSTWLSPSLRQHIAGLALSDGSEDFSSEGVVARLLKKGGLMAKEGWWPKLFCLSVLSAPSACWAACIRLSLHGLSCCTCFYPHSQDRHQQGPPHLLRALFSHPATIRHNGWPSQCLPINYHPATELSTLYLTGEMSSLSVRAFKWRLDLTVRNLLHQKLGNTNSGLLVFNVMTPVLAPVLGWEVTVA